MESAEEGDYALDYGDVFGGPPRRSSSMMQMFRHNSFGETAASNASSMEDERSLAVVQFRTSWTNLEDKPVFGQEASSDRDEFFDDIFRGDEICSSPRGSDRNPILANDPFASSYPQLSLPSDRRNSSIWKPDEIRSRTQPAYKPSPLSHTKEELSKSIKSPKENNSMFHFTLYKWAGKGSPVLNSLKGETIGSRSLTNSAPSKHSSSSPSSNHIIADDEERQDYNSSSKTMFGTDESILDGRLHQEAQKQLQKKKSMTLRSFLDELDTTDLINTKTATFEGERTRTRTRTKTKTESSGENLIKKAVKGKIKWFAAKIFDSAKPQNNIQRRSQSQRWDRAPTFRMDTEDPDEMLQWASSTNKAKIKPDSSKLVNPTPQDNKIDKVFKEMKMGSEKIPPLNKSKSASAQTDDTRKPPESVQPSHEDIDDILGDYFQVKELFEDDMEDNNQVLDSKIQQWAQGKEGNIRSLLSTLPFVLWPNSGWKPIALVDIIEGNAVKRAYQKTLLYLHPDKLQQRGATPDQHYIARKVFDLLQEAWDQFNTVTQI